VLEKGSKFLGYLWEERYIVMPDCAIRSITDPRNPASALKGKAYVVVRNAELN
jgi:hypothetical protein